MPVRPAEHDLPAAQVADPLDPQPERLAAARSSAPAGTWTRWRGRSSASQRSPKARACRLAGFGIATTSTPPGSSSAGGAPERRAGVAQVLERVPEDDRGAGLVEVGELDRPHVVAARVALEPDRGAPARRERVEQGAVAGADVEHRARRARSGRGVRRAARAGGAAGVAERRRSARAGRYQPP